MTIADVLGILGFCLSVVLGYLYLKNYFARLGMFVSPVEVHHKKDGSQTLLLFHISFVNRSSVGKTVCEVSYIVNSPYDSYISDTLYQTDIENGRLLVVEKSGKQIAHIPLSEYLECPLDIQPHQSQSKCYPLLLLWEANNQDEQVGKAPFVITFSAYGVSKKICSSSSKRISADDLHRSVYIP